MVGTRKKIMQPGILVFVEPQAKDFHSTLNVTMMSVTFFYTNFYFVLLKSDPSPL